MISHEPGLADERTRPVWYFAVARRIGAARLLIFGAACAGLLWLWGAVAFRDRTGTFPAPAPGRAVDPTADPGHRDVLLRNMRLLSRPPHRNGWSAGIWNLAGRPGDAGEGDADYRRAVRAEVVAAAVGIDAWKVRQFPNFGAFFVTTDRAGVRLLLGGVLDDAQVTPAYRARIVLDAITPLGNARESGMGPVAFREDGTPIQLVARAGRDDRPDGLELIDLTRGELISRFDFRGRLAMEYFHELGLAPDGAVVGAPIRDSDGRVRVRIWEAGSGRELHQLDFPGRCLAFTPGRSLIASGDNAGQVRVWSLATGQPVASFKGGGAPIRRLLFGADPRMPTDRGAAPGWLLAVANAAGTIAIRAVAAGAMSENARAEDASLRATCKASTREVTALGFSPDRTLLAAADQDEAYLFDAATGKRLLSLDAGAGLQCLTFSPQGQHLAFCTAGEGEPGTTSIWGIRGHGGIDLLRGLAGRVVESVISPEPGGSLVAAYAADGKVGLWDRRNRWLRFVFPVAKAPGSGHVALAFSPDRGRLAYAGGDEARLWDTGSGKELRRWSLTRAPEVGTGSCDALAFAAREELLLYRVEARGSQPGVIRIRNLLGPDPPKPVAEMADLGGVRGAGVTRDGKLFIAEGLGTGNGTGTGSRAAAGSLGHVVNGYDGRTGRRLWSVPLARPVVAEGGLRLDPTGATLALPTDAAASATSIDAATGESRGTLSPALLGLGTGAGRWVSWIESGAAGGGGITFHERGREEPLFSIPPEMMPGPPDGISFSPDGIYAAWGNSDGTVAVCDLPEIDRHLREAKMGW